MTHRRATRRDGHAPAGGVAQPWVASTSGSTALAPAYARLPVAFVDAWRPEAIDAGHLAAWQARLAPEHDDPVRRGEVVTRLGLDYWWARITAELH